MLFLGTRTKIKTNTGTNQHRRHSSTVLLTLVTCWILLVHSHESYGAEASTNNFQHTTFYKTPIRFVSGKCEHISKSLIALEYKNGNIACLKVVTPAKLRGELYSFHLSELLGLGIVLPNVILKADSSLYWRWKDLPGFLLDEKWFDDKLISLSLYQPGLEEEFIPDAIERLIPPVIEEPKVVTPSNPLLNEDVHTAKEPLNNILMYWSDYIVFDFLSGQRGRLSGILQSYNNLKYELTRPVPSLYRQPDTRKPVLLNNGESFSLPSEKKASMEQLVETVFLEAICYFRDSTKDLLLSLTSSDNPIAVLENYVRAYDTMAFVALPSLTDGERKAFNERVEHLKRHFDKCAQYIPR